jgi:hypothetical protein
MRQPFFSLPLFLLTLACAAVPAAARAADYGKTTDIQTVRTTESAALQTEVPPVQRGILAVTVSNIVVAGNYAICSYSVGESAGYSVYARSRGRGWKRISHGGDAPTKPSLRKLGVPEHSIAAIAAHGGM